MTWLSNLLALALTGASIAHALPSPHEDLPWNVNGKRHDGLPWNVNGRRGIATHDIKGGSGPDITPAAQLKENIWKGLSNEEVVGLLDWVHKPEQGLNLTSYDKAGAWDNHVTVTEQVCIVIHS